MKRTNPYALQAGDASLDAGAEVPELAIDPTALDNVFDLKAATPVEGHVAHAERFGLGEVLPAGKAAIVGRLSRRAPQMPM